MGPISWKPILRKWNEAVLANPPRGLADSNDIANSLGFAGASETAIKATEVRLKAKLPPSYRAFLKESNGWKWVSEFVPVLRPVEKIRWFRWGYRDWIDAYQLAGRGPMPPDEMYFTYGTEFSTIFRGDHLRQTLLISDVGDSAVFLLNPQVVHADGEWEAWFLADWAAGVTRHRSFGDLMMTHFRQLVDEPDPEARDSAKDALPTVYRDAPGKPGRREQKRKPTRNIEQLLKVAKDRSARVRYQARLSAIEELGLRKESTALPTLLELARNEPLEYVRGAAMVALGRLKAREAIEVLIGAIERHDREASAAMGALGMIGDPRGLDCLLNVVAQRSPHTCTAVGALAETGDTRAVKFLLETLRSKRLEDRGLAEIAGREAAMFGEAALDGLAAAAKDGDPVVVNRALRGLFDLAFISRQKEVKMKATEILRHTAQNITDEGQRKTALDFLSILPMTKAKNV